MKSYFIGVVILIVAYLTYGKYLEKNFGIDNRETPALLKADGVDFVEMNWIKSFLVQFLNIAGLGPITGAVAGAMWGSSAFLWIVFGTIFVGAVHDYYTGMISMRNNGENMQELIGKYLGNRAKLFTKYFLIILLIIVGVAFITGPAEILQSFTGINKEIWLTLIVGYYIVATLLPIDKIIGRVYPLFGGALVLMMFLLIGAMLIKGVKIPEVTLENMHPKKLPIFPYMFVVISCGAISGFHSTQSVLVARCLKNEKDGRKSFMAAMYLEGFVALTWAAISLGFFNGVEGLAGSGGGMVAVSKMITGLLGKYGLVFTLFGLIALPITTGDTAFGFMLPILAGFIGKVSGGNLKIMIAIIIWVSAVASAFIDNIPFAATMIPVINDLAAAQGINISILAWALAMGTDIGGSATPIGASANVVGIATAAKSGHMIKWGKYCKAMAPATILVILISMLMIYARYL